MGFCLKLNVFVAFFNHYIIHKLPDMLLIIFAADQQNAVVFYRNVSIKAMQHNQFVLWHVYNAVAAVIQHHIVAYHGIFVFVFGAGFVK